MRIIQTRTNGYIETKFINNAGNDMRVRDVFAGNADAIVGLKIELHHRNGGTKTVSLEDVLTSSMFCECEWVLKRGPQETAVAGRPDTEPNHHDEHRTVFDYGANAYYIEAIRLIRESLEVLKSRLQEDGVVEETEFE